MINAVTSTSTAASSTTAAARQQAEESAARRAGVETAANTAPAPVAETRESAVVTISAAAQNQEAQAQAQAEAAVRTVDTAAPTKPDWSFAPPDGNKDGRVTYFEQQFYDIRNFPDSLQQVLDLNKDQVEQQKQQAEQVQRTSSSVNADLKAYEDVANAGRRSP